MRGRMKSVWEGTEVSETGGEHERCVGGQDLNSQSGASYQRERERV